jgi:hypothetical protein
MIISGGWKVILVGLKTLDVERRCERDSGWWRLNIYRGAKNIERRCSQWKKGSLQLLLK